MKPAWSWSFSPSSKIRAVYPITMDNYPMAITKIPVLVKTCLVFSHKLYVRPETPAPSPFLPGMAKSRPAPGLLYLGLLPRAVQLAH